MPTGGFPDAPAAENFVRRAYHASIALGEYVFIEGGEIAMMNDGSVLNTPNNNTLTLDMTQSWTNDSVEFSIIKKTTDSNPPLNQQILWPGGDNRTAFAFGGEVTWLLNKLPAPPIELWQLTSDGQGGGNWSNFNVGNNPGFAHLRRPDVALGATVDETGFILGGLQNSHSGPTTQNLKGHIPIPGIVAFNMSSNTWSNSSMPSSLMPYNGKNGILASVPTFGPRGLLVATGINPTSANPEPFHTITIYEPGSRQWHNQTATGDVPEGRDKACVVGVQGDNGTYEVFVYGGYSNPTDGTLTASQVAYNLALDSVYVLSLPAFTWFKADYTPRQPRCRQTCQVVGNRQMLSVGGNNPLDANSETTSKDPMAQGLQIFDLSDMTWSSSYDAHAAPYTTPQVVKDWYNKHGTSSVQWNDPAVKGYFAKSITAKTGSPAVSNSTSSGKHPNSSSSHTGTIAGGVVGGVAIIALIVGFMFWLFRRKRRQGQADRRPDLEIYGYEKDKSQITEPQIISELDNGPASMEADSKPRAELAENKSPISPPSGKRENRCTGE